MLLTKCVKWVNVLNWQHLIKFQEFRSWIVPFSFWLKQHHNVSVCVCVSVCRVCLLLQWQCFFTEFVISHTHVYYYYYSVLLCTMSYLQRKSQQPRASESACDMWLGRCCVGSCCLLMLLLLIKVAGVSGPHAVMVPQPFRSGTDKIRCRHAALVAIDCPIRMVMRTYSILPPALFTESKGNVRAM